MVDDRPAYLPERRGRFGEEDPSSSLRGRFGEAEASFVPVFFFFSTCVTTLFRVIGSKTLVQGVRCISRMFDSVGRSV